MGFSHIPLELLIIMLKYLTLYDLVNMSYVSRDWYRMAHGLARFLSDEKRKVLVKIAVDSQGKGTTGSYNSWDLFFRGYIPHNYSFPWKSLLDVSALDKLDTLDLFGCVNLVDVSPLREVHNLRLSYCQNVVDVTALSSVHTLDLSNCIRLVEVSALDKVHTLNLSGCVNVVDVTALGSVHTLILSGCVNVVDVTALGSVHTLILSNCDNVVDVTALGSVHTLNLSGCDNVVDVSALGSVHTLIEKLDYSVAYQDCLEIFDWDLNQKRTGMANLIKYLDRIPNGNWSCF